jgi:hypothetical protein
LTSPSRVLTPKKVAAKSFILQRGAKTLSSVPVWAEPSQLLIGNCLFALWPRWHARTGTQAHGRRLQAVDVFRVQGHGEKLATRLWRSMIAGQLAHSANLYRESINSLLSTRDSSRYKNSYDTNAGICLIQNSLHGLEVSAGC